MSEAHDLKDEDWVKKAEQNILDLAEGAEGEQEKLDKEGTVHNLRYKLPPNLDANKFILKNKSKGKWADKTEITSTQINVNLTASYNEVNQLMEKQRLLSGGEEIIEAEVVNNDESV